MSDFFQSAYSRARGRYTQDQWLALTPAQITDAIYREMRAMDGGVSPGEPAPPPVAEPEAPRPESQTPPRRRTRRNLAAD